jgi:hypothetical protein
VAISIAKPQPQPKLTVAKPTPQPALKVVPNYGMQGSTYSPQRTVSPQTTASPQRTASPQPTYNPQQAATAAQVAAAAEQIRVAQAQEIARQKEVKRQEVQGQVDSKVNANKAAFTLQVSSPVWRGKLAIGKKQKLPKIVLPEQSEYDKAYADAY